MTEKRKSIQELVEELVSKGLILPENSKYACEVLEEEMRRHTRGIIAFLLDKYDEEVLARILEGRAGGG
jgi:hypothetical protein